MPVLPPELHSQIRAFDGKLPPFCYIVFIWLLSFIISIFVLDIIEILWWFAYYQFDFFHEFINSHKPGWEESVVLLKTSVLNATSGYFYGYGDTIRDLLWWGHEIIFESLWRAQLYLDLIFQIPLYWYFSMHVRTNGVEAYLLDYDSVFVQIMMNYFNFEFNELNQMSVDFFFNSPPFAWFKRFPVEIIYIYLLHRLAVYVAKGYRDYYKY